MKTQYYTATSLDGFIAAPNNSLEWLFQFGEVQDDPYPAFIREVGALAMGSTTYQWLLDNEIYKDPEQPKPWPYEQPTWVFTSRQLPVIEGANIKFVQGDVRPIHAQMREAAGDKNIWVMGGGELVGQFYDHGLLDELFVFIASVTLGGGASILPRAIITPPLELVSVKALGTAFAHLHYKVARQSD